LYWSYGAGDGGTAGLAGTLLPLTLVSGGSGYTPASGSIMKTMSGGACSGTGLSHPQIQFTMNASGTITGVNRVTPGFCTAAPSVVYPSGGSGGSVTAPMNFQQTDFNYVGQLLYDNTGTPYSIPSGFEPGEPVTTVTILQGPLS
jgi:hypothetical protein